MSRHDLKPSLQYRGLRYARTSDEAFRTARYGAAIERPQPSLLQRIVHFFRRRLA